MTMPSHRHYVTALFCLLAGAASLDSAAIPVESFPSLGGRPAADKPSATAPIAPGATTILPGADPELVDALRLLNEGKADEAVQRVRTYLRTHPKSAPAQEILGAALAKKGEINDAMVALKRATELDPARAGPFAKLGDLELERGRRAEARKAYQEALRLDAKDPALYQNLGAMAEVDREYAKAIEIYERGVAAAAPDGSLQLKVSLARTYNQVGQYRKAATLLESVPAGTLANARARVVLGTSYLGLDRPDDAIVQFEAARSLAPQQDGGALGLGIAYRSKREFAKSEAALREVIRLKPDGSTGYFQLAETQAAAGNQRGAIESFRRAEALSTNPGQIRKRVADMHVELGELPRAIGIYEALLKEPGDHAGVLAALGRAYQLSGRQDDAASAFKRIVEAHPREAASYLLLGEHHAFVRNYKAAIAAFDKGLKLAPNDVALLRSLALAQSRSGDMRGAVASARRLVENSPKNPDARFFLASLLDDAGDRAGAIAEYRKVLAAKPDHVLTLNNLAMALVDDGKAAEAVPLARKAVELDPRNPLLNDSYGWALLAVGKTAEALPILEEAAKGAPKDPSVLFHLASAQAKNGQRAQAKATLTSALAISTDFRGAKSAETLLKTL